MAGIKYKDPVSGQWVPLSIVAPPAEPTVISFPTPQSTWIVDIGRIADVVIVNSAGDVCEPGTIHYNGTQITMGFSAPFSGTAYCF